jgi:proline racemase
MRIEDEDARRGERFARTFRAPRCSRTVLRWLVALDASVVVPGHGRIEHDLAYPRTLIALIDSVRTQGAARAKSGVPLAEAKKKVDVASFARDLAGDDPKRRYALDVSFVEPAVERGYEEAQGKLSDE